MWIRAKNQATVSFLRIGGETVQVSPTIPFEVPGIHEKEIRNRLKIRDDLEEVAAPVAKKEESKEPKEIKVPSPIDVKDDVEEIINDEDSKEKTKKTKKKAE